MYKKALKSTLFKNFSALALIQMGNYLLPLLIVPYISRIIGLENYGKLEYARALIVYFTIFIDYGFNLTVTREISINRNDKDRINRIVSETFFAKLILLIIAAISLGALTYFFEEIHAMSFLLWVTFLINIGFFLFPLWFFQGMEKLSAIAFINFFIKLFFLVSVFFLIKKPEDFWRYNLIISFIQIAIGIVSIYILKHQYGIQFKKVSLSSLYLKYKEGFNIFFSTILVSVFVTYAFILLKKYGSDADVGAYSTAFKLAMIIQGLIILPFTQAFFPHITKLASENIVRFKNNLFMATYVMFGTTLFVGLISYFFAHQIILIIFGNKFLYAVPVFKTFAFLPVFTVLTNIFAYQGLLSLKKDKVFLRIHIFFAILVVIVSSFLVPLYGLMAVTYIRIISELLLMLTAFFFLYLTLKNTYYDS